MKRNYLLAAILLAIGLARPASAQCYQPAPMQPGIFVLAYEPCGTPIYAKRVLCRGQWQIVRLDPCEVRRMRHLARARAAERAHQRRLVRERLRRSRHHAYRYHRGPYARRPRCR